MHVGFKGLYDKLRLDKISVFLNLLFFTFYRTGLSTTQQKYYIFYYEY